MGRGGRGIDSNKGILSEERRAENRRIVQKTIHKQTLEKFDWDKRDEGNSLTEEEFVEIVLQSKAYQPLGSSVSNAWQLATGNLEESEKAKAYMRLARLYLAVFHDGLLATPDKLNLSWHSMYDSLQTDDKIVQEIWESTSFTDYRQKRESYLKKNWPSDLPQEEYKREMIYQMLTTAKELETHPQCRGAYKNLASTNRILLQRISAGKYPETINVLIQNSLALATINMPTREIQFALEESLGLIREVSSFSDRSPIAATLVVPEGWNDVAELEVDAGGQHAKNSASSFINILESDAKRVVDGELVNVVVHENIHACQNNLEIGYADETDRFILEGLTEHLTDLKTRDHPKFTEPTGYYIIEKAVIEEMVKELVARGNRDYLETLEELNLMTPDDRKKAILSSLRSDDPEKSFETLKERISKAADIALEKKGFAALISNRLDTLREISEEVIPEVVYPFFEEVRAQKTLF